ncbi:MAG: hypothetical protein AAFQ05_01045 [Pseudomonadota bacterium]
MSDTSSSSTSAAKGITFADTVSDLPGGDFHERLRELRAEHEFAEAARGTRPANDRSTDQSQSQAQGGGTHGITESKSLVEQDNPHPVLRPSPGLAGDVDREVFVARLEAERDRTAQHLPTNHPTTNPTPQKGPNPMADDFKKSTSRPVETLREGSLKAAIWRNDSEKGPFHSVTLARTYTDKDGNPRDSSSFRATDMLSLSELTRRAHHGAHEHDRAAFKEHRKADVEQSKTKGKGKDQSR